MTYLGFIFPLNSSVLILFTLFGHTGLICYLCTSMEGKKRTLTFTEHLQSTKHYPVYRHHLGNWVR